MESVTSLVCNFIVKLQYIGISYNYLPGTSDVTLLVKCRLFDINSYKYVQQPTLPNIDNMVTSTL